MLEENKAYIVLSTTGIGKTKKMHIEFINMSDDTGIMMTGTGLHWLCEKHNELCQYIGMKEMEKILLKRRGKGNGPIKH